MSFHIAAPAHKCQAGTLAHGWLAPGSGWALGGQAIAALLFVFLGAPLVWSHPRPRDARQIGPEELVTAERYEVEVSFQPERGSLHARATVLLRAVPPPPSEKNRVLGAVEFELNPHLKILEVTDQRSRKLEFDRSGRLGSPKLLVRLAEPITVSSLIPRGVEPAAPAPAAEMTRMAERAAGITLTLTFTYEGVLPTGAFDYITKDGILLRDESRWYPAVNLSAFTQNDITITMPRGWLILTSGQSKADSETRTARTIRWSTTRRVSSRSIVGGSQTLWTYDTEKTVQPIIGNNSIHLRSLGRMDHGGNILRLEEKIITTIAAFAREFGNYPQSEMTVVQGFPGQRGAIGYSAPGFLVVSEDMVKFFDYPGYATEFLPHEIAHQWFPIEVTIARQEDGWIAESLAEYLAWRYLREKNPEQARRMVARAMRDALAPDPMRPLSLGLHLFALENNDVTRATLYQRGMLVFRTLETVIDRERLDRALREYYQRFAGKSASIGDFRKICEEISGRHLGWFFDYFLNRAQIPEIQIRRTPSAAPNEVSGEIIVRNVPPEFQVRVEMRVETLSGPAEHSVATRGEVTPFTITVPQAATRLILDPDQRILRWTEAARRNRAQRLLLSQLGNLERAGQFARAAVICQQSLALDPENLAANEQQLRLELGRLRYHQGHLAAAWSEFDKVLALGSLDSLESDFNRAWSRVYRARTEKRRGRPGAAHAEARAGLAANSPALDAPVAWPQTHARETTAARELQSLAK